MTEEAYQYMPGNVKQNENIGIKQYLLYRKNPAIHVNIRM